LERVQVKYADRGERSVIEVRCYSMTIVNGKVRSRTPYTLDHIDWLAVYDAKTDRCFYIPASELGEGRFGFTLRLRRPRTINELASDSRTSTRIWTPRVYGSKIDVRWSQRDSNPRPPACRAGALPAELWPLGAIVGIARSRDRGVIS
jgi:hypothetical protein